MGFRAAQLGCCNSRLSLAEEEMGGMLGVVV